MSTTSQKLAALIGFAKSLDPTTLKDIEDIESVVDGHGRSGLPTPAQVDAGPAQAMRGGQAQTQITAHSDLRPQEGNARDYEVFQTRMTAMEKAVGKMGPLVADLVKSLQAVAKAEDGEKDEDEKDVEKALRKARIAIVKAEDKDEDDDVMEKAHAAIAAASLAVSKAEDEADDDDKEKAAEKARGLLKGLRGRFTAAKSLRAAPAVVPVVEPAVAAPAVKAEPSLEDALSVVAAKSSLTVPELMARMGAQSPTAAAPAAIDVPVFAKSIPGLAPGAIVVKASEMADDGLLTDVELVKCESLAGRLRAVQDGKYDATRFADEVALSSDPVKRLFGA